MTLALDTVAPTTLTATYDDTAKVKYTVEAVIKSIVGLGAETLRDIVASKNNSETGRKARFVAQVALLVIAEREAAHAEAVEVAHAGTTPCDGCAGDGVFRYAGGCFENGVWKGKTGTCFRCNGTGRQAVKDQRRNRYYDSHVRRIYA